MDAQTITVASLGRMASVGDLYDARRDAFCGIPVFRTKIPESALEVIDDPDMKTEFVYTDKMSDKFKKLDVSAELQVSVLGGLIKLEGSGRYLNDQKNSARSVKISLIYNIKTAYQKLNILHDDLKDAFAMDILENDYATHVVTGVSWGANSIISCSAENRENRDITEISGKLSAALKKFSLSIEGKAEVDFKQGDNSKETNFEIKVYGDVLPRNEELPTTFQAALELVKQIPNLVSSSNNGKGKPLAYQITPIRVLQNHLKFERSIGATLQSLEEASLLRVVQFVEHLSAAQQELNDFYEDATQFKYSIQPPEFENIVNLKQNLAILETSFRAELSSVLTEIRSGKANVSQLEQLIKKFQQDDHSADNIFAKIQSWSDITERINFAKALVDSGAKYIGLGNSLDEEMLKNFVAKSLVFYFSREAKSTDPGRWIANRQIFFQEMKKENTECKFYAVDCDIHPGLKIGEKTSCVQILQDGQVLTEDMLEEQEKFKNTPWAQISGLTEKCLYKPNKRAPFHVPCTGRNCDPIEAYDWKCTKCLESFEYGFDSYVYCSCGKTLALALTFKCTDCRHGNVFEAQNENFLVECVSALRPFKELNILILGETGVGKSTWINGFINFLSYESLEDALKEDLLTLIPSKFTMCNEKYEEIVISTGCDKNEVLDAGKSATQDSKVYQFSIGKTKVRLIDTPGIGDTRGIDQDRRNFQNILGTISNLEELHGICILLKPNNARLNVMFRFCIKELLTNLHKDAGKNIVFCFTNSRGTFYKPGETLPALRKLLAENSDVGIELSDKTIYCYDSEAYRFLAAMKNKPPVKFDQDDMENFSKSWNKSINETSRMLEYICGLQPHNIKSTVNLNHARESIVKLTKPLAEINKTININKSVIEDEMKAAMDDNLSKKQLEDQKWITRMELVFVKLDHPRTVCSNSACCKSRTLNDGIKSEYTTHCHNPCGLSGVPADTIGNPELLKCWAMTNGVCRICGHSYQQHLHTYYDAKQEQIRVEDQKILALLNEKLTKEKLREKLIELKKQEIQEYNDELKVIREASVNFAYFLKMNAITAYNDGMEQYLDHLIREEQAKVGAGKSRDTLENLEDSKRSYIEHRNILEQEMNRCDSGVTPPGVAEVEMLVKKLQKLPRSGPQIRKALDCVEHTSRVVYRETVVHQMNNLGMLDKAKKFFGKLASWFV